MAGTTFHLQVNPRIPERLARLEELAMDLWYGWDRPARSMLSRLDAALWEACERRPRAYLKRIDQKLLEAAADDPLFLATYNRVMASFDDYRSRKRRVGEAARLGDHDLIAYFCAEYGLHDSLPIFSGGLGILAGDHCKGASDLRMPLVAVGLLYRQGYFKQSLDLEGNQIATYADSDFDDLPIREAIATDGQPLRVQVDMEHRTVVARVWHAQAGHVSLYLLDTDIEENSDRDRVITHRLYGGDRTTRIEQELLLGVGGVRALTALGLKPTVWHINEGHAAFLILARVREFVERGLDFDAALEAVAANTVFTTHTPVPAGHDHFTEDALARYLSRKLPALGTTFDVIYTLGRTPASPEFNMTALAIRGSRFHNGVSRIHGDVSARMLASLWPEVDPAENPMTYVTNGVHVPSVLATDWHELFDRYLGLGWLQRRNDPDTWARVYDIPDHLFFSVRQSLKSQMLHLVRQRILAQYARHQGSEAHLDRLFRLIDPENPSVLTIGFARRFAVYKRATLLFENLDWLREILGNADRPVVFIFAGKAHPADGPGQSGIRRVAEVARMREFEGKVLLVEGYDLHLARRLVAGCDVWLNNPLYPLEASGTSGMKAAVNGGINLSVLDGWWGEGYDGSNGWAIRPAYHIADERQRNLEEARALYEILEDRVVPLYYARGPMGFSPQWVAMAKRSIATLASRYSAQRMVSEYVGRSYVSASAHGARLAADNHAGARELAAWKNRVRRAWSGVSAHRVDAPERRLTLGEGVRLEVAVALNGLEPGDVSVQVLLERANGSRSLESARAYLFEHVRRLEGGAEDLYALDLAPEECGDLRYRIRLFPHHRLQAHPFEVGLMRWL